MKKHSVILVDDDPFLRQTLSYQLKKQENIDFIASYQNGAEAVENTKKNPPEIIIMDIEMPVMDGIEAARQIKQFDRNINIIMLTSHSEKEKVFSAFSCGANAYCVKNIKTDELLNVIDMVSNGNVWLDKSIAGYLFEIIKTSENQKENEPEKKKTLEQFNITPREQNILKLISDGFTNAQIADELVISLNTVKNHVASIIDKLSVKDRTQIAIFTLKNKLLD